MYSLPDMKIDVSGSFGSRVEPKNCCDSGGKESESGFKFKT